MKSYLIAPNGIFHSVQGEGELSGLPMVFIRLAGCSVGCPGCDTDYRVAQRLTTDDIVGEVIRLRTPATRWVWITGGEPTDHDLAPLCDALRGTLRGGDLAHLALATSGVREVKVGGLWLSVSPHDPSRWTQRIGAELKLVDGLNGVSLKDFLPVLEGEPRPQFAHRYVCPLWHAALGIPSAASVKDCLDWVGKHPGWKVNFQGHKQLGLP